MKKISLLLVGLLALFSCEQEELENFVKNNVEPVQTRAASSIVDFDPLLELAYLPVNVINVGSVKYKYMTVGSAAVGERVRLAETDDGSLKQRWFVRQGKLILAMGNGIVVTPKSNGDPVLSLDTLFPCCPFVAYNNFYNIRGMAGMWPSSVDLGCLQAKDKNSSEVKYAANGSSDIAQWRVVPVGQFKIIKMEYEKSTTYNDFIKQQDVYLDGAVIGDTPTSVTHTFQVSRTISEGSSFSEAYGVVTQNQSSFGWSAGLGVGKVNIGFNGQISNSSTSSETVTYGTNEIKQVAVSQTFVVTIPPHTPCRIEVLKRSFNVSITYIATLEKTDGDEKGKQFRIKGRWDGVASSDLYYNTYTLTGRELIDTHVITQ